MPIYSFKNKKTNEVYDLTLSYEEMLKYKRKRNVEYILSAGNTNVILCCGVSKLLKLLLAIFSI